ncbi:MAG: hypothetical protein AAF518_12105 [Spirochaetota bacterium]
MGKHITNIHFANFLKSAKYNFTFEDSNLIGKLTTLGQNTEYTFREAFAEKVLDILQPHHYYAKVQRVCIAKIIYPTNELMAVASANYGISKNLISNNYRCFVNPEGSLFKLDPNTFRIFDDVDEIIASFAAKGVPPQRTIRYIYEMGFKSGLCISLFSGETLGGFLFLNTQEPGYFDNLKDENYGILSILQLVISKLLIQESNFTFRKFFKHIEDLQEETHGKIFDVQDCSKKLNYYMSEKLANKCEIKIESSIEEAILFSPYTYYCMILAIVQTLFHKNQIILIRVKNTGVSQTTKIYYTDIRRHDTIQTQVLIQYGKLLGYEISFDELGVELKNPIDFAYKDNPNILYSI